MLGPHYAEDAELCEIRMSPKYLDYPVVLARGEVVLLANFGADRSSVHRQSRLRQENETDILTLRMMVVDLRLFIDDTVLHDEDSRFHFADIGERIAGNGNDISPLAGFERSDLLLPPEQGRT